MQAESRADLRAKLAVDAGGVVFTTIQKFLPEEKGDRLHRRVCAPHARRATRCPHASFIGFTGTPIELTDKNTRAVFTDDEIAFYDALETNDSAVKVLGDAA